MLLVSIYGLVTDKTVAIIDDIKITKDDIKEYKEMTKTNQDISSTVFSIAKLVAYSKLSGKKIGKDKIKSLIENYKSYWAEQLGKTRMVVSEQEAKEFYENNKYMFAAADVYKVSTLSQDIGQVLEVGLKRNSDETLKKYAVDVEYIGNRKLKEIPNGSVLLATNCTHLQRLGNGKYVLYYAKNISVAKFEDVKSDILKLISEEKLKEQINSDVDKILKNMRIKIVREGK